MNDSPLQLLNFYIRAIALLISHCARSSCIIHSESEAPMKRKKNILNFIEGVSNSNQSKNLRSFCSRKHKKQILLSFFSRFNIFSLFIIFILPTHINKTHLRAFTSFDVQLLLVGRFMLVGMRLNSRRSKALSREISVIKTGLVLTAIQKTLVREKFPTERKTKRKSFNICSRKRTKRRKGLSRRRRGE